VTLKLALKILVAAIVLVLLIALAVFLGIDPKTALTMAIGALILVAVYLGHLALTQGLPAALAKLKAWWNKGKADLATIQGDVANAQTAAAAVDAKIEAKVLPLITRLRADVDALKTKVPV
jgi:hypothetical protein